MSRRQANIDHATVQGFGEEWTAFDQSRLSGHEFDQLFDSYFRIFPFSDLRPGAEGFDLGCGSGRWATAVALKVGILHCIDPAEAALGVAKRRLAGLANVRFHLSSADMIPLADGSQDFGYSLGVLHHVPDAPSALTDCVRKLKPGAPFLVYLYYALDNRPSWFKAIWKATDIARRGISRQRFPVRKAITEAIAVAVYWPLARAARLAERLGVDVSGMPLSTYRNASLYTMRTDAHDRFGTKLEQRFSRAQVETMMRDAGLVDIRFSERPPYWVACGRKAGESVTKRTTSAKRAAATSAE